MAIRTRGNGLEIDVQVTRNGRKVRHRETVHMTLSDAQAREAQIRADLMAGREIAAGKQEEVSGTITLGDALEAVHARYWANGGMARTVRSNMATCVEFFGKERPLNEIDNALADDFVAWLHDRGYAVATVRQKVAVMTKTFNHYYRRGNIRHKPHFPLPKPKENRRFRIVSEAEEAELLRLFLEEYDHGVIRRSDSHAGQDFVDLFTFLVDTGARPSEARAVRMDNVRGDIVLLVETKTGTARSVPLTRRAKAALQSLSTRYGDQPMHWATPGTIRHAWDWARDCMGLSDDTGFIPYALRHTCATRLYRKTRDIYLVQRWLGHTSPKMTQRYAMMDPVDLASARDLLEAS